MRVVQNRRCLGGEALLVDMISATNYIKEEELEKGKKI